MRPRSTVYPNPTPARSCINSKIASECDSSTARSVHSCSRPKATDFTKARVIVQRYDDLEREVRSLHQAVVARLTVASIYSVGLAHMSRYLREFLAANPQADIRLEYLHPHRVYDAVDSGQADLGLISYPEESKSLAAIPWRTEPMVLVCHPEHPLAGKPNIALKELQGEAFVAFQTGLAIRNEVDRVLALDNVTVKAALEFDNIETIKRAVEIGSGVSLLPEPTIERELSTGTLVKVQLAGRPLVRPLGIIHRRDRELSDTARRFVHLLQSHQRVEPGSDDWPHYLAARARTASRGISRFGWYRWMTGVTALHHGGR